MSRVVILGAKGGPAVRQGGAMPTSLLVEMAGLPLVVDCGLGVTRALVQAGMDLRRLSHVVITHLHSDHVLELGPLIHTAWTTGLRTPVDLWGPAGLRDYWTGFMASMAYDSNLRVDDEGRPPLGDLIRLHVLDEGPFAIGPMSARALRVPHPPVTDTFAFRLEAEGKSLCLSADTAPFAPLADLAQNVDLLLHEAMLPEGLEAIIAKTGMGEKLRAHLTNSHSTADAAARIATEAGAKHLAFYHLIPADDPAFTEAHWRAAIAGHWDGPFTLARDGLAIEF
jgi:ribonuclease BN (tRNA processing enzyme)